MAIAILKLSHIPILPCKVCPMRMILAMRTAFGKHVTRIAAMSSHKQMIRIDTRRIVAAM
jgi:hypothetical protein